MKLLLISLAVCLRVGATYAQWEPRRDDVVATFNRPVWQPSWVDQDRYSSYITPNWVNGRNSYILNPYQFWYQPYSTLPYPMGLSSRYMYQNRWNQQDPIRQYQDNWSSGNNYNYYANPPWNRLGWSQRQEYRPFRNEGYQQEPIPQNYYPRQQFVHPETVQPSYDWNLRNWNLNKQYHPINAYHPYQIQSYQPISVNSPSYPHESYHPYAIRSHHSYPSKVAQFRRQSNQPNPIRHDQSERGWYKKPYIPSSAQTERPSPISSHQPKVNSHGSDRNWYLSTHYNPILTSHQPSVQSYDSRPIWSRQASDRSHSHLMPQRFYPLNFYLSQQARQHQHPKGIHYNNDNQNHFYHLYHSHPYQSNHGSVNKHIVPVKKDQIDLSTLWFLNKLLTPVSPKPTNRSFRNPGLIPFDLVIVKKVVSPVKPKLQNRPHRPTHRSDVEINTVPLKENPSTIKPVFNGRKPVPIKPFRPLHEKVVSEKPQRTVLVNWSQPSSFHGWYPQVNPWHPENVTPATATVA